MTNARHDYAIVGNIGFLKIRTLNNNQFSIRNDRLKTIDELRVFVEETNKKYRIFKKDFETLRHHKHYDTSLFGEKNDYKLWYYSTDKLEELIPISSAVGKTSVDLPMATQESRWDKGKETIKEFRR